MQTLLVTQFNLHFDLGSDFVVLGQAYHCLTGGFHLLRIFSVIISVSPHLQIVSLIYFVASEINIVTKFR